LTLKIGSYWLSRNFGVNLQAYAAEYPRTAKFSCRSFLFHSAKSKVVFL
jgi:hypothetical protein